MVTTIKVNNKYYPGDVLKPNELGIAVGINPILRPKITKIVKEVKKDYKMFWSAGFSSGDFFYLIEPILDTITFLESFSAHNYYELESRSKLGEFLYG